MRPRRSLLFMPGVNARALAKARELPADGLIFDLEDAVAPAAKGEARAAVGTALAAGGYGRRELVVRVNGLDTPWGRDDLAAAARCGCDAVLLPKVESGASVRRTLDLLEEFAAPDNLEIWCMLETPRGILRAEEIATASTRVAALVMGTSDLTKELRARHTPDRRPLLASLGHCLLVARAYGLTALDGVHLDLHDDTGFAAACRQGVDLGFDGKTLIHPKTIAVANSLFAPDAAALAWARKVITVHSAAMERGEGIVVVDGQLIENLHVDDARRLVALAAAISALEAANLPAPNGGH
ncbi:MAG: malyl-CoA thiolesterase [Desulfuromonadales bacterium GWC2_61_20]|nr:MAG: malyl-CoA thiolesterase [Desulfuromonadales bacterium GWC2_61_20]